MEVEARSLVAGYGGPNVLDGVCLSVKPGEMVALLGPNGSGKSTLIRCLSRTLRLVSGEALVGGEDVYRITAREAARRVAVVPQQEDPVFDFTVAQIVEMGRYARGGGAAQIRDALRETRLEELADRPVRSLSGGERQRVLLARALAQETPVLLLDEPTAHMDVGYQIAMLSLVRSLSRGRNLTQSVSAAPPRAILIALHDLNLASGFADRAVLLHDGRIVAQGPVEDVLQSPEIERVYGAAFDRIRDERTGRLILVPEFVPERAKAARPRRVHVIGGGGSAAALITELWQLGHSVTLGITHSNDSDCETAARLAIPTLSAAPFSSFTEEHRKKALEMAHDAEFIIIAPAPYGPGNIENLRLAEDLARLGKDILVIARPEGSWDFTGGEGERIVSSLGPSVREVRLDMAARALET